MMKRLFVLFALLPLSVFAELSVCRITPDKIVYPLNTDGVMTVVLKNNGTTADSGQLEITEQWNLEQPQLLQKKEVKLAPGETQTLKIPYNSGSKRYGHVIRATIRKDGKVVSTRGEYFNVINEWWRVSAGPGGPGTIDDRATPILKKTLSYYGLTPRNVKNGKILRTRFSSEQWEALCPEIGPFLGYGNMETRWLMQLCSVGGNYAASQLPPDKVWYPVGSRNFSNTTRGILKDSDEFHKWGMHHTRYTLNTMESYDGIELARKYPQYMVRTNRGSFEGYYMHENVDPIQTSKPFTRGVWTYFTPDFYQMEVLDFALDDLIAGIKAFREDGVYFDGRYCPHGGYDYTGADLAKKYDTKAVTIRNMKHVLERFRKEMPEAYIWSNGVDGTNPEGALLKEGTGVLKEIQQTFITSLQGHTYHKYRSLYESLINSRNQLMLPGKNSMIQTDVLHIGYLGTWSRNDYLETRECWTWSNHVLSMFASVLGHTLAYQVQFRPVRQLQTGYSQFYWNEGIKVMKDGYRRFRLDSLREIWYEDTIYTKETPEYTDYYLHLINVPETETAIDTVRQDPPEADDVEISTKLFSKQGTKVKAWALQPYGYDSEVLEPVVAEIMPKKMKGELVFTIPAFRYYTLLVIRKYNQ